MKFTSIVLALSGASAAMAVSNTTSTNSTGNSTSSPTTSPSTIASAGANANQVGSLLVVVGAAAVYFL